VVGAFADVHITDLDTFASVFRTSCSGRIGPSRLCRGTRCFRTRPTARDTGLWPPTTKRSRGPRDADSEPDKARAEADVGSPWPDDRSRRGSRLILTNPASGIQHLPTHSCVERRRVSPAPRS
jgi:hypothetical protein